MRATSIFVPTASGRNAACTNTFVPWSCSFRMAQIRRGRWIIEGDLTGGQSLPFETAPQ